MCLGLGLGLERHCLGLGLGLDGYCLGLGLGLAGTVLVLVLSRHQDQDSKNVTTIIKWNAYFH